MENSDDIRLIVKIAQLYYEQEMTQAQIAHELGIYRTTISRLLKRGRELGVVTIAINYDYNDSLWLEERLKQKFGLKEAVVAPLESEAGTYGAQLFERLLSPNAVIGFGWGRAVSALVEALPQSSQPRPLVCVPIVGGPSGKLPSRYHVNTLTYSAATRLKGESYLADFPALLDNPLIRQGIMQSQHFQTLADYWQRLDIAVVGIGSPAIRHAANWQAFYGNAQSDELEALQVAGDICSRFFAADGTPVATEMQEKTLSIELATLKQARYVIGLASGEEKHAAILGALRGQHINALVTDRATAEYLVQ
ncbi:sugar-binding transcriptional regulator [Kluyvera chengduensis]|uniref:sugar-binding transcriptional regulator n=1 Tax=Kluyvera sp. 142359 TaxID=3375726 RepID=UPI003771F1DB